MEPLFCIRFADRFTILACLVVAVDSISCMSLWIAGGDSKYLERSVEKFSPVTSTFDLACLAAIRGVTLIVLFFFLERAVLKEASAAHNCRGRGSTVLHVLILLTAFVCLCYAAIKGGLVLHKWTKARQMYPTYKAVCIVATIFPFLELLIGFASFYFMSKLRTRMIMLVINEANDEAENEPREESWKSRSRYPLIRWMRLAGPDLWIIIAGTVSLLISTSATSVAPYLLGQAIDYAICQYNNSSSIPEKPCGLKMIDQTLVYLSGILAAGTVASLLKSWLFTLAGIRYLSRLKKWLFATIMKQDIMFIDQTGTKELLNRLSTDIQVICDAVIVNIPMLIAVILQICAVLGLMFWQNPTLALLVVAVIKFIIPVAITGGLRIIMLLDEEYKQKLALIRKTAEESISKIRTVRTFSNEVKMTSLFERYTDESYAFGKKSAVVASVCFAVLFCLVQGTVTLLFYAGSYMIYTSDPKLTAGVFTAFLLYALILVIASWYYYNIFVTIKKARLVSAEVIRILDHRPTIVNGDRQLDNALTGEIKFENINFRHPLESNKILLQDVSFIVHPGDKVALVGPCKESKLAIFDLIENFYDVQIGRIHLDRHDMMELDSAWLRQHIGVIRQEPVLLSQSISDNIGFGKENATQLQIIEAARQANAHEFITHLERGYATMVQDVTLLRSQKQRVAIARALLPDPPILLIDEEATHSLDAEGGHWVELAIDQAMNSRTVIVIASRLSTIKTATQVLVVNNGRVTERASRDELLAAIEPHCSLH